MANPVHGVIGAISHVHHKRLSDQIRKFVLNRLSVLGGNVGSVTVSLTTCRRRVRRGVSRTASSLHRALRRVRVRGIRLSLTGGHTRRTTHVGSRFLTGVSRRLHAPLGNIVNFAHLALGARLAPARHSRLGAVRHSTGGLLTVVGSILSFSGLRTNGLVLRDVPFPLHDALSRIIALLTRSSRSGKLRLALGVGDSIPSGIVNSPLQLRRVVAGLIKGTVGFARGNGVSVLMRGHTLDGAGIRVRIRVQSANVNVPRHSRSHLFRTFQRTSTDVSHHRNNAKLKLIVARGLIGRVNNSVSFRDRPGHNSAF